MNNNINVRPIHYACVSGGKDSLYMFYYILNNLEKYPLDMVVHFELEIDYPFIKNVINNIKEICKKLNIKFISIRPRKSFNELYDKYGYPTRVARWCNGHYKMDCARQINEIIKSMGCRPLAYIGFCANEEKRFKYTLGDWLNNDCCYPLAEDNILEDKILEWAKQQPIFNNYYNFFNRCGCMGCPCSTYKEFAYLFQYYPKEYKAIMDKIIETEKRFNFQYFKKPISEMKKKFETKSLTISLF